MPARQRTIGPDQSEAAAEDIRSRREELGWTMALLSANLFAAGYDISAATINHIENGIRTKKGPQARLITVDELKAFAEVLQVTWVIGPGKTEMITPGAK